MPVAVRIDVPVMPIAGLQQIRRKLGDFRTELRIGREDYGKHVAAVFASEGAAGSGAPWPALSPMRQGIRARRSPGLAQHPILVWDRDLINVATFKHVSGNKVSGSTAIGRSTMELNISGEKVTNNFGNPGGKFVLPKREFWPFSQEELDIFMLPFELWAQDLTRQFTP